MTVSGAGFAKPAVEITLPWKYVCCTPSGVISGLPSLSRGSQRLGFKLIVCLTCRITVDDKISIERHETSPCADGPLKVMSNGERKIKRRFGYFSRLLVSLVLFGWFCVCLAERFCLLCYPAAF